jgi:hypothetical protein
VVDWVSKSYKQRLTDPCQKIVVVVVEGIAAEELVEEVAVVEGVGR